MDFISKIAERKSVTSNQKNLQGLKSETYHYSKTLKTGKDLWPQEGEKMSDFLEK